jgi:hypothetical protein
MILKNGLVLGPYWGKSIQTSIGRDQLGIQSTSLATYSQLLPGEVVPMRWTETPLG